MPGVKAFQQFRDQISELAPDRPVLLVAVSKRQTLEKIRQAYSEGQRDFGENYVQELLEKESALRSDCPDLRWHFIGHLQKNKIKKLISVVFSVHSVDSVELAIALDKAAEKAGVESLPIFLEVNIDDEPSKAGFSVPAVSNAVTKIALECGRLLIMGLMGIPKPRQSSRDAFQKLSKLRDELGSQTLGKLSMGMSADYEIAIECGSDYVRIGSALFGERKKFNDTVDD